MNSNNINNQSAAIITNNNHNNGSNVNVINSNTQNANAQISASDQTTSQMYMTSHFLAVHNLSNNFTPLQVNSATQDNSFLSTLHSPTWPAQTPQTPPSSSSTTIQNVAKGVSGMTSMVSSLFPWVNTGTSTNPQGRFPIKMMSGFNVQTSPLRHEMLNSVSKGAMIKYKAYCTQMHYAQ